MKSAALKRSKKLLKEKKLSRNVKNTISAPISQILSLPIAL
jgi:hypothetical protein